MCCYISCWMKFCEVLFEYMKTANISRSLFCFLCFVGTSLEQVFLAFSLSKCEALREKQREKKKYSVLFDFPAINIQTAQKSNSHEFSAVTWKWKWQQNTIHMHQNFPSKLLVGRIIMHIHIHNIHTCTHIMYDNLDFVDSRRDDKNALQFIFSISRFHCMCMCCYLSRIMNETMSAHWTCEFSTLPRGKYM